MNIQQVRIKAAESDMRKARNERKKRGTQFASITIAGTERGNIQLFYFCTGRYSALTDTNEGLVNGTAKDMCEFLASSYKVEVSRE